MRLGLDARWLHSTEPVAYNRYLLGLLREFQRHSDVETVLFTERERPPFEPHLFGLRTTVVPLPHERELFWEQLHLPRALKALKVDVYHAPADTGIPVLKMCPSVLTSHGVPHRAYLRAQIKAGMLPGTVADYLIDAEPSADDVRRLWLECRGNLLLHLALRRADRILTPSKTAADELAALLRVPKAKLRVTYLAPGPEFRPAQPGDRNAQIRRHYGLPEMYWLSVGTVTRIKNTAGLLQTMAAAKRLGCSAPLVICAPMVLEPERYRTLAAELGLQIGRDVFLLERVATDLPALYRGAAAFMILSWRETFSLPVVEAMACGTPVIASHAACLPEIVGDAGLLVDPANPEHAASALMRVLRDPALGQTLRGRALERSQSFSWSRTTSQTLAAYRELTLHR